MDCSGMGREAINEFSFCTVLAAAQRPLGRAALITGFSTARRSGTMGYRAQRNLWLRIGQA